MAETTGISWTDSTFNPWIGCTKVGPGCDNCYAEALMDHRWKRVQWGSGNARQRTSDSNWKAPLHWEKTHEEFERQHGRRRRVFCASLADVFDNEVPPAWRVDLLRLMESTPHLDWLVLTKRIGNVERLLDQAAEMMPEVLKWPLPNVWLGATVVNQQEAERDIPKLLATPAAIRFLSIEPMLGPINLGGALWECCEHPVFQDYGCYGSYAECCGSPTERGLLDWVIVGGESGGKARPIQREWIDSVRQQCDRANVPFFFKQWGGASSTAGGCSLDGLEVKAWP